MRSLLSDRRRADRFRLADMIDVPAWKAVDLSLPASGGSQQPPMPVPPMPNPSVPDNEDPDAPEPMREPPLPIPVPPAPEPPPMRVLMASAA